MDIKAELAKLMALIGEDRAPSPMEKAQIVAILAPLAVLVTDDSIEVPADVFEALSSDARKFALAGLAFVLMQTLEEK